MNLEVFEDRLAEFDYQPLTSRLGGRLLYDLVVSCRARDVLELGFAHGTSTAYLAAAVDEIGGNLVTTIDREEARDRVPNIEDVMNALALQSKVMAIFSESSYTWELMRLIERSIVGGTQVPCFDFCFIDGAHSWEVDGFAFFLVDKLLRDDSWIVFDDVHWSHATSPTRTREHVESVPRAERTTQQIAKVFELLVRQHPAYDTHRVIGDYACAYKGANGTGVHRHVLDRLAESTLGRELALAVAHKLAGMRTA